MAQTIFFDLDGTLSHSRAPFEALFLASCAPLLSSDARLDPAQLLWAWSTALEEPGAATTSICLARALDSCGIAASRTAVDGCASALNQAWARAQERNAGAEVMLAALQASSVEVGIITNGPSDAQRAVVSALGLDVWCRWLIVSGDADVGVRKPEAGIFLKALGASSAVAHETWYVGDSAVNDVLGASRVGMRTCWLSAPDAALPTGVPEPDMRISALPDLTHALGQ